jgi:hypothetical protein
VPITAQAHALEVGALQLLADRRLLAKRKSNAAAVSTTNSANQNDACIIKDAAQLHRFRWLLFSP